MILIVAPAPGAAVATRGAALAGKGLLVNRWTTLAAGAVVIGLWLPAGAAAQDYEIRLDRPFRVGQEYRLLSTGRQSQKSTLSVGGQAVQVKAEEYSVQFEAAARVLEIDRNGEPSRLSLSVAKCTLTEEGEALSPIAKDAVVFAYLKDGKPAFETDGAPAGPALAKALGLVISLGKGNQSEDVIFGTRDRKKVGDHWAMNAELAAKDAQKDGLEVRQEDITGSATLAGVVKAGDTDCLDVRAEMAIARIVPPVPAGFAVEKSTLQARFAAKLPVDPSRGKQESAQEVNLSSAVRGKANPDDPEMLIETALERRVTTRFTYPK
jgi:hypothetical protein